MHATTSTAHLQTSKPSCITEFKFRCVLQTRLALAILLLGGLGNTFLSFEIQNAYWRSLVIGWRSTGVVRSCGSRIFVSVVLGGGLFELCRVMLCSSLLLSVNLFVNIWYSLEIFTDKINKHQNETSNHQVKATIPGHEREGNKREREGAHKSETAYKFHVIRDASMILNYMQIVAVMNAHTC